MILVLNAGSSSLRFSLFDEKLNEIKNGHVDGIHTKKSKHKTHKSAIDFILKNLDSNLQIKYVGHRIVHGGENFTKPLILNKKNLKEIEKLSGLAPLHNPANLEGIKASMTLLPKAKHIAIFDTAFHSELPEKAFLYGLPYSLYKKDCIRKYGFHGISHKYVAEEASRILKKKNLKLISCHMGNGISLCAIQNGKSIDTSMGFTPLEGPIMGTRAGSFDPAIIFYLAKKYSLEKIEEMVQKKSGFLGLSEKSSDIRDLYAKYKSKETQRTFGVLTYQLSKLILSYCAGFKSAPDAIIFTAGIGENAHYLRSAICEDLKVLGVKLDSSKNRANKVIISKSTSKVKVLVIPANEALQIAKEIKILIRTQLVQ